VLFAEPHERRRSSPRMTCRHYATASRVGRPRSNRLDLDLVVATQDLMVEVGYERLTVDIDHVLIPVLSSRTAS
jgi:hypothetical protein